MFDKIDSSGFNQAMFLNFLFIGIGAVFGAWIRWLLGVFFNPFFPSIPLGTLFANLLGAFIIGIIIPLMHALPDSLRLGIVTGFLGALTTFSTFSAETTHLLLTKSYFMTGSIILLHVGGSLFMTAVGMLTTKLFIGG